MKGNARVLHLSLRDQLKSLKEAKDAASEGMGQKEGDPNEQDLLDDVQNEGGVGSGKRPQGKPNWAHAIPAGLLALALLVVVLVDLAGGERMTEEDRPGASSTPPPTESLEAFFTQIREAPGQSLLVDFSDQRRFGITVKGENEAKRLTFDNKGETNNTIIRIFDPESTEADPYFNLYFAREQPTFKWVRPHTLVCNVGTAASAVERDSTAIWALFSNASTAPKST